MVKDEVRVGLGSGRIPLTVSVGDGDAPARGCLCPILTGNLAAFAMSPVSYMFVAARDQVWRVYTH